MRYQIGDLHNIQPTDPIFDEEIDAINAAKEMVKEVDKLHADGGYVGVWEVDENDPFRLDLDLSWIVTLSLPSGRFMIFKHSYTE